MKYLIFIFSLSLIGCKSLKIENYNSEIEQQKQDYLIEIQQEND